MFSPRNGPRREQVPLRLSGRASSPELQGLPLSPRGSQVALTAGLATPPEIHHETRTQIHAAAMPSMGPRSAPLSTSATTLAQHTRRRGVGATQSSGSKPGASASSSAMQQSPQRQGGCQPWAAPRLAGAPPTSLRHAANVVSQSISSRYGIVGSNSAGELAATHSPRRRTVRDESNHAPGAVYHQFGGVRCPPSTPMDAEDGPLARHPAAQCLSPRRGNNDLSSGASAMGASAPSEHESMEQLHRLGRQMHLLEQQIQEEAASHAIAQRELERQLSTAGKDLCACSAKVERVATEVERASDERAGIQAHLDSHVQEVHSMEAMKASMHSRLEKLEAKHAELQQRLAQQQQDAIDRESHAERRSKDLTSREQDLELHQQLLEDREAELADIDEVADELHQKKVDFESWRSQQEERLKRQLKDFATPRGQHEMEKENRRLRDAVQEQREGLFKAEGLLRQEETALNFPTPGELIKMAKKHETETHAHAIADMKLRIFGLARELVEINNFNEVLRKNLPVAALEAVETEVRAKLQEQKKQQQQQHGGVVAHARSTVHRSGALGSRKRSAVHKKGGA